MYQKIINRKENIKKIVSVSIFVYSEVVVNGPHTNLIHLGIVSNKPALLNL